MAHCLAFPEVLTTQEPLTLSLLCSESIPFPGVVDAAAVVVANEGNTVGDELPRSAPPTIEPWPGRAWLSVTGSGATTVVVDAVDVAVLDAVSAVAIPPERATDVSMRAASVMRWEFMT